MKAIIFGGTGWVGHNIVLAFHNAGYEVTVCSRGQKTTYLSDLPEGARRVQANKNDAEEVKAVFEESFDVVVDSVPSEVSIDNIANSAKNLTQYLHCSSTGGYAPLPVIPGDETTPYDHFMGGWKAKGVVDSKVMDLWERDGFPATVIRPTYITGPGLLPLDNLGGRRDDFITDILNETRLDLPSDGQALLQPIHVKELARSFLLAAEHPQSVGQIYNITLEKAVTLNRYQELTAAALDREAKINYLSVEAMLEKYAGSVSKTGLYFLATHMCYDISKARDQLGFVPRCTTEEAITETARWAAEQMRA